VTTSDNFYRTRHTSILESGERKSRDVTGINITPPVSTKVQHSHQLLVTLPDVYNWLRLNE